MAEAVEGCTGDGIELCESCGCGLHDNNEGKCKSCHIFKSRLRNYQEIQEELSQNRFFHASSIV